MNLYERIAELIHLQNNPLRSIPGIEPIIIYSEDSGYLNIRCGALVRTSTGSPNWVVSTYHGFDSGFSHVHHVLTTDGKTCFVSNDIEVSPETDLMKAAVGDVADSVTAFDTKIPRLVLLKSSAAKKVERLVQPFTVVSLHDSTEVDLFAVLTISGGEITTTPFVKLLGTAPSLGSGHSGRVFIHPKNSNMYIFHAQVNSEGLCIFGEIKRKQLTQAGP